MFGLRGGVVPRLTKDQWLEARQRWEADPTLTFEALAAPLGVSRPAVSKMAEKQGWVKSGCLDSINRAAQVKADAAEVTPEVTGVTTKKPQPASVELSTGLRSKLIQSHRAEWRRHAGLYPLETIKEDFDVGKSAKISAEMLQIRQKAERVAWGMEEKAEAEIVIRNPRGNLGD